MKYIYEKIILYIIYKKILFIKFFTFTVSAVLNNVPLMLSTILKRCTPLVEDLDLFILKPTLNHFPFKLKVKVPRIYPKDINMFTLYNPL
ncbi:hypothetical protein NQ318_003967 [Aromia moschata]|uniref:Uncharacterized protein n=1 Tax=Aromia moschata TaxID=1265417 RepID=A0AAV8Z810_9CUCU|nr:hypothetical protein NQ318_003967 [Aromia moschata]